MDIISMIMSKNQGGEPLASTEEKKITFDGDLTGKTVVDMGDAGHFVKVSDEVIKATEFKYLTLFDETANLSEKLTAEDVQIATEGGVLAIGKNDGLLCASDSTGDTFGSAGTYVVWSNLFIEGFDAYHIFYISELVTETIHPIDPKYLPGVHVVNLEEHGVNLAEMFASGSKEAVISGVTALDEFFSFFDKGMITVCAVPSMKVQVMPTISHNGANTLRTIGFSVASFTGDNAINAIVSIFEESDGDLTGNTVIKMATQIIG